VACGIGLGILVAPESWAQAGDPGDTARPAAADVENQRVERAKARFREAEVAYSEGRYRDAIDAFLDADRIHPLPAFSYNIALAYEAMGDPPRALSWYREYVRRTGAGDDVSDATERISSIERSLQARGVQQVTVLTIPESATIAVDGRAVGVAPWTGELMPGKHRVEVSLSGHASAAQEFDLPAHRAIDVSVQLLPAASATPAAPVAATHRQGQPSLTDSAGTDRAVRWPTWLALGAGGTALGGSALFEVLRGNAEDDIRDAPTQREAASRLEDSSRDSHQTTARVLALVGGGLLVTGGVLLFLDLTRSPAPSDSVVAGCGEAGCGVLARGQF
jgi:tetratricopeptide (TPR) repeat protein